MPLESISTSVVIYESLAKISLTYTFVNPKADSADGESTKPVNTVPSDTACPIEATYKFPKLKDTFVARLSISVGDDRVIEARVCEKEKAEQKYGDAIAAGHTAAMLRDDKDHKE